METKFTCFVIEDEPLAQELILKFIKRIPSLIPIGVFDNAIEAIDKLDVLKPTIIFLDVSMPEMTGIELVRTFTTYRPHIIFTTAHHEFALDAFEHDAVDYLLKPIPFDRFMRAIQKVKDRIKPTEVVKITEIEPEKLNTLEKPTSENDSLDEDLIDVGAIKDDFLWVKEDRKLVKIDFNDIVYIEAMKDYLKIFLKTTMIITHMTMSKIESVLSTRKSFLRINRSFIINTKFMKALDGNMIELENGKKLPIGTNYRDIIKNAMKSQLS
ncbi:MAG: LytR/AlgR family response regulator transcription factor [Flavobacterium sp.]